MVSLPKSFGSPRFVTADFYTISDTVSGISFNISKNFEPIPKDELTALNPGFSYGFRPAGDTEASCIVSHSKLRQSGAIPPTAELRDGLLKEIKKIHPDAKLSNPATAANPIKFGDAVGVLLEVTYKEKKQTIKRAEVIGVNQTAQAIAYCQSPASDNPRYYQDFTIFFSSLKLTNVPN